MVRGSMKSCMCMGHVHEPCCTVTCLHNGDLPAAHKFLDLMRPVGDQGRRADSQRRHVWQLPCPPLQVARCSSTAICRHCMHVTL